MQAQMSPAAWGAGCRNAGIVSIGLLFAYVLLILAFHFLLDQSWLYAFRNSMGVVWAVSFVGFFVQYLRGWLARGDVLLNCGSRPMRFMFFFNACVFPYIILSSTSFFTDIPLAMKIVLAASFVVFYLVMGLGRMQLCEHGIWTYAELVKWERIKSYHWEDASLFVEYRSKTPIPAKGVLSFPPDRVQVVDFILREQLLQETS
ncbi:MAG: hypothetical protein ACYDCO_26920 [Armatimonadota bacterium]